MDKVIQKDHVGAKGRLVTPRRRKKLLSRKEQEVLRENNALRSVSQKLGVEKFDSLQTQWAALDTRNGGSDQVTANGMIVCLLQQELT